MAGIGRIVIGVVLLGFGVWAAFIGTTSIETRFGSEGYGLYEVRTTWPLPGIPIMIAGVIGIILGVVEIARSVGPTRTPQLVPYGPPPSFPGFGQPLPSTPIPPFGPAPTSLPPFSQPPLERRCPNCGVLVPSDSKFCISCGRQIGQ